MEVAKERCQSHYSESKEVYMNDFKWGVTLLEMSDKFEEIYSSGKRLYMHTNYDKDKKEFVTYLNRKDGLPVTLTENFIKSVTNHIEVAIANGFADYVFFPDMGHTHLYFPQSHWDSEYGNFDKSSKNQPNLYKKMLSDPKMKALYHLAEQLKMQDENKKVLKDKTLFFKYWHRNFVGMNDGTKNYQIEVAEEGALYNTVKNMDEHDSWSAGIAVSASEKGCFPYIDKDGNTRYFDIGLVDPRYDPNQNSGEWGL